MNKEEQLKLIILRALEEMEDNMWTFPSIETCIELENLGFGQTEHLYNYSCEQTAENPSLEEIKQYSDIKVDGDFDEFTMKLCIAPNYLQLKAKLNFLNRINN